MSTGGRLLVILGAVVAAIALFFIVRGGGDGDPAPTVAAPTEAAEETTTGSGTTADETTTAAPPPPPGPRRIVFGIPAGGPQGIQRVQIQQNERVVLVIRSAVADHAHLHGYDLITDVAPGQPARIGFRASVPGRFEIELEDRGEPFGELTVTP